MQCMDNHNNTYIIKRDDGINEIIPHCPVFDQYKDFGYFNINQFVMACWKGEHGDFEQILTYTPPPQPKRKPQKELLPYSTSEEKKRSNYIINQRRKRHKGTLKVAKYKDKIRNEKKKLWDNRENDRNFKFYDHIDFSEFIDSSDNFYHYDSEQEVNAILEKFEQKHYIDFNYLNLFLKKYPNCIRMIFLKEKLRPLDLLNIVDMQQKEFDTLKEFYIYLGSVDIGSKLNIPSNKFIECPFIDEFKAICVKGEETQVYRFFILNHETEKGYIFSFVDLLTLYNISIQDFIDHKQIRIIQLEKIDNTVEKYNELLKLLKDETVIKKYPYLTKYIKSYTTFIEFFINLGIENIRKYSIIQEGIEPIFFYSLQRIIKRYGNINKSTASTIINALCILGLFNKVKEPDVFKKTSYARERDRTKKAVYKYSCPDNYFVLNNIDLERANNRAKILLNNSLNIKALTRAKVSAVFGVELADSVFQKAIRYYSDEDEQEDLPEFLQRK